MFILSNASRGNRPFIAMLLGGFILPFFLSCKKDSENYLATAPLTSQNIGSTTANSPTGTKTTTTAGTTTGTTTGSTTGTTTGSTTTGTTTGSTTTGTTTGSTTTGTTASTTTSTTTTTYTYTSSGPIMLRSNMTISGLSIDLGNASTVGITGNNVTNVHITNCRIVNTTGFAILLTSCSNITIDNCFISNVGFGVYAQGGSSAIKVNSNQFLNINGINTSSLGHAVQFNAVNGGGSQINNNRIENIAGVALHPHDIINLYQCNGLQGDSIQVIGNWIRGGQLTLWPDAGSGAAGILIADVSGSYQVCRNNILVNPGYAGIQCIGTGYGIKIDHNQIFSTKTAINSNAINILDNNQITVSYNKTNWTNHNGINALLSDGETQYYLGSPASPTPINFNTNSWGAAISASILPTAIISMK